MKTRAKKFYLGIDIGGTSIKAVRMENFLRPPGECISLPTPKTRRGVEERIARLAEKITEQERGIIAGIGIGIPGVMDRESGKIVKAPHVSVLNGWNIARALGTRFRVPVKIDNDSRLMLIAEVKWGSARGRKSALGIAIGTGIGGGLMADGRIVRGAHGAAGEFGHMLADMEHGDEWEELGAKKAFRKWGDRSKIIGRGIASLINAFDPEVVVIGGGGMSSGNINIQAVRREAKNFVLSPRAKRTPIVKAVLGERAQAAGAALLFAPQGGA